MVNARYKWSNWCQQKKGGIRKHRELGKVFQLAYKRKYGDSYAGHAVYVWYYCRDTYKKV